jgi:3-hydroxyisobutyrate dehydrogenase-like beta-hydroxyacid dehydrogenase
MAAIAVLGTGAMGSRIAVNLVKAGHRVSVWNRTPGKAMPLREFGARIARDPRAAAGEAEFAIAMVRDDDASTAVWLDPAAGALAAMPRGSVAIECSTLGPRHVGHLAERCASAEVGFLDAPVVGSRPQAEAARLVYLVGGDAAILERARPVLSAAGDALHHAGPPGAGTILKLAINALLGIQVAAAAELFGWLQRAAIDLPAAVRIIGSLPSCSIAAKAALESMLSQSFSPLFPAELARKDLDYALEAGGDPAGLPVTAAGRDVFASAIRHGYGADNLTGVVRLYTHHRANARTSI